MDQMKLKKLTEIMLQQRKYLVVWELLKNGAFMEMEHVFKIHSTASKCLLAIHMGTEENVFYILRMQGFRYAERR